MNFPKISTVENVGVHDIKRKSPWKPSFEWEDFSSFVIKDSPSTLRNLKSSVYSPMPRTLGKRSLKQKLQSEKETSIENRNNKNKVSKEEDSFRL